MKSKFFYRVISVLLCLLTVIGILSVSLTAGAAVLPDNYEYDYENTTYQDLGILEDQYDLIEPINNLFPIISPNSKYDVYYPYFYKGSYKQVEDYLNKEGMTDGLSIVPPTKIKAEKFLGYSSYGFTDTVATVDGRPVKAYMVAANAIMAGCTAELTPFCIAFTEALANPAYLDSLRSGELTPMMYVNGPACHQIGIDNTQGMTTEESNIALGRFMELALINFTDIDRTHAFGNVQPLVFSENDETCLKIGWTPHHVEKGFGLNDNIITATSFSMWGNNVTPATDLPEEIMKVLAWDITEKNLGGLGGASVEDNANTRRLIFITESVATALATKYKTKDALESALVTNARRPLWMRTYAYYYANTGSALTRSFSEIYNYLSDKEHAQQTAAPPWMNGITYAEIDTVPTMIKGNTDIIVTGDSSRNKTQVIPGGVSVNAQVKLSNSWDQLVQSVNFFPYEEFELEPVNTTITPPSNVPSVLTNGTYRILDPQTGASYLTRAGRVYFDSETDTLYYYAQGASSASSIVLDPDTYSGFITYFDYLGYNSSFTVNNGSFTNVTIRFSSNASKLNNNTVALTSESFSGMSLTLHANNSSGSNAAGGLAKDGATVDLSASVTSYTVSLDGTIVMGERTNNRFVTLSGSTITVDPTVEAGATAIIGAANGDGTYRTMTLVNGGDGTYTVTYHTANTLSITASAVYLKGSFNGWEATDPFEKTADDDIIAITMELSAGTYEFKVHQAGTDKWYGGGDAITDTVYRMTLNAGSTASNCSLTASGGTYEFKFELSTNKLSVYYAENDAIAEQPTGTGETEPATEPPTQPATEPPTAAPTEAPTQAPTEPATATVYVGIITYLTDQTGYQVHYWGGATAGDVDVVSTGKTTQKAVGNSYWSNSPQTFNMYTAEIPADATGFKVHKGDDWIGMDGNVTTQRTVYIFEYGGSYHAYYDAAQPEFPTEPDPSAIGYYLVGTMTGWSVDPAYKLTESATSGEYMLQSVSLSGTDQVKVVYSSDGSTAATWYPSGMNTDYDVSQTGVYNVSFRPAGNSAWTNGYFELENITPHTVTWLDGDGNTLKTDTVIHGNTPPAYDGVTPTKTSTAQYSYTFNNTWSPAIGSITADTTYTAQFNQTVRTYTVTWKNYDGTFLDTNTAVAYGAMPTYDGATPVKPADVWNTYTFSGWTPAVSAVKGNISYTATYSAVPFITVYVTTPTGDDLTLSVTSTETIAQIKAKIEQQSGVPTELQKLIYADRPLDNASTLADYAIEDEAPVRLKYNISHSLTLDGAIGVNFYIGVSSTESSRYTFTLTQGEYTSASAALSVQTYDADLGMYKVTRAVDVPEMTDDVTLTLYRDGSLALSDTFKAATYGIATFRLDNTLTDGDYYLVGTIGGVNCWGDNVQARYRFKRNWSVQDGAEEYELANVQLHQGDEIKVIAYSKTGTHTWYPANDPNYTVSADGTYTIWFRPQGYNGSGWWHNCFYVSKDSADNSSLYELTRAALRLGAKAQLYFGHRTDDLADSAAYLDASTDFGAVTADMINARIQGYSSRPAEDKNVFSAAGLSYYGSSLVLNDSTKMKIYFTVTDSGALSEQLNSFTVGLYGGTYRSITPTLIDGGSVTLACFEIPGIPAAELENTYCIRWNGHTYYYSALDYARLALASDKSSLREIGAALYWYNVKADAYFG